MTTTVQTYMTKYAGDLSRRLADTVAPLHDPSKDQPLEMRLLRQPLPAQAHVITAAAKHLRNSKSLIISASMGTGKTFMAMGACHAHANGPYRAIVVCPPHLCHKWEREIKKTIPGAHVHHWKNYRDAVRTLRHVKPFGFGWWIMSDSSGKLGTGWRPATEKIPRGELAGAHRCPHCKSPVMVTKKGNRQPISTAALKDKKIDCEQCESPLWQWTSELDRWPVATFLKEQLNGFFDYAIFDEVHRAKSSDSEVGNSLGALAAASKKIIAMTGTLCGGYADHLRPLLWRLAPTTLVEAGLSWSDQIEFTRRYGRLKRIVSETTKSDCRFGRGKVSRSNTVSPLPGITPSLFGEHLIGNAVFLDIMEMADNLPEISEEVVPVEMDSDCEPYYRDAEQKLVSTCKEMAVRGDRRLLGAMLHTLLSYPDFPYEWSEVGYHDGEFGEIFVPVVTPMNLERMARAKDRAVIDLCKSERDMGRQVWLYTTMTNVKDTTKHLETVLKAAGLRAKVLKSSTASATEREAWIEKNAPGVDVMISHPQLVDTGIDFFDGAGTYNFPTIGFYNTGFRVDTVRQAGRRHWRIGQKEKCRVVYWYYQNTMQARAVDLMSRKVQASLALEGSLDGGGLASLSPDDGSITSALCAELVGQIQSNRTWERTGF
jgi:hypothetical protein